MFKSFSWAYCCENTELEKVSEKELVQYGNSDGGYSNAFVCDPSQMILPESEEDTSFYSEGDSDVDVSECG